MNYFIIGFEKKAKELIADGKAKGKADKDFSSKQIAKGVKVEKEHTNNPSLAKEIAKDHLTEFPNYYTALDKMETKLKKEKANSQTEKANMLTEKKTPTLFPKDLKHPYKNLFNKAINSNYKDKQYDVMLKYKKPDGTESERRFTPYTTKNNLVIGKDHSREGQIRSFKLDNILQAKKHK